jgi:hypothetical protein
MAPVTTRPFRIPAARLASVVFLCALARAQAPSEYQVKAVFLLNFTKFIEWPATAFETSHSPMEICILGNDPFGNTLDQTVKGEVVNGRPVAVKRLKHPPPPRSCHVLFAASIDKEMQVLTDASPGRLTVGEGHGFLRDGGMIGFVIESRRVRFDVNQTAAKKAGLKISSKLLAVARSVEEAREK